MIEKEHVASASHGVFEAYEGSHLVSLGKPEVAGFESRICKPDLIDV